MTTRVLCDEVEQTALAERNSPASTALGSGFSLSVRWFITYGFISTTGSSTVAFHLKVLPSRPSCGPIMCQTPQNFE
jgi:hypothetical protein